MNETPVSPACPHTQTQGWIKTHGAGPGPRWRVGLVLTAVLLLYCALAARMCQIQVTQSAQWKKQALDQQISHELVPAQRGQFLTDTGLPITLSLPRETVIADLKVLKDPESAAETLAPLLKIPAETLLEKMSRTNQRIVYLERNIDVPLADQIRALKIRGIGFEDAFQRTYPQGTSLCHLIGWAGLDGGMEGLELGLDSVLRGTPGYLRYYRDAARRLIARNDASSWPTDNTPPRDGVAVTLTIDAAVQQVAEEQLQWIRTQFEPKSASCICMDCNTGAILAMASIPTFDPNEAPKYPAEDRRCRIETDFYEPGSVFKTFIGAGVLERNLWRRNEIIFCHNGLWDLGHRTLHDAHAFGNLSFDDVFKFSSNIGAALIAQRLGIGGLYDTVKTFGFGDRTGINLPGESPGMVHPRAKWTQDSLLSVAFGHEIGVTPLQLITAFSSVVNSGILLRPKVVQRITDEQGEELYTLHPQVIRRTISATTSAQMREILARVVSPGGTGLKAFMPEYAVGGKTGTTKKIDPVTHQYSSTLYIGSFCGFAPVDHPRLVCLVVVDEPKKSAGYYGATVACPSVREVLRKGLAVLNVPPRNADEQRKALADARKPETH